MALTAHEKALCREAAVGQWQRGYSWGSPTLGMCPVGRVITERGGNLYLHARDGLYHALPEPPQGNWVDYDALSTEEQARYDLLTALIETATTDVLAWSGYQEMRTLTTALLVRGRGALPKE